MKNGLTRRDALKSLGIGSVGAVAAGALAAQEARAAAAHQAELQVEGPSILPVGLAAGAYSVVRSSVASGALRVELSDAAGDSYVAIVCDHDPASNAPATSGQFDVFVENQGQGDTPTVEHHGLSAMALARALGPFAAEISSAGVTTLSARQRSAGVDSLQSK